jgi:hypothetical protein
MQQCKLQIRGSGNLKNPGADGMITLKWILGCELDSACSEWHKGVNRMNTVKTEPLFSKTQNFLTSSATTSFLKMTLVYYVGKNTSEQEYFLFF